MNNRKINIWRILFYIIGATLLCSGVVLSTRTMLGVSTIVSVPFVISNIWNLNFALMNFIVNVILVGLVFIVRGTNAKISDLLQIPFSLLFSMLLDFCDTIIMVDCSNYWVRILVLILAIVLIGCGSAMMANVQFVTIPPNALADAIGEATKKGMGFGKNLLDFCCVALSCAICLIFTGEISGIGIGTVLAMLFIGRVVAVFNGLFKEKIEKMAGVQKLNNEALI